MSKALHLHPASKLASADEVLPTALRALFTEKRNTLKTGFCLNGNTNPNLNPSRTPSLNREGRGGSPSFSAGVGLLKLKSFYVEWMGYKNPCNASMCRVDALRGCFDGRCLM